jgi:predicted nuclease of restriction endonuclease-like (RecB) superfamily
MYPELLKEIKDRVRQEQIRATMGANAETLATFWDIGRIVNDRQKAEGWGTGVISRLAHDIRHDLADAKGFSERNIRRMLAFYREYPCPPISPRAAPKLASDGEAMISPRAAAKLSDAALTETLKKLVPLTPWGHNFLLIEKVKNLRERVWYTRQSLAEGWSRDTLAARIKSDAFRRQEKAVAKLATRSPKTPETELTRESLKDPYLFDFLTLTEPFREKELENGLAERAEKCLLELDVGFALVGRQYHLEVSDKYFYIDLLFYHTKSRCYVVVELKKGEFRPEYAGKVNFFCSAVDDLLRMEQDNQTIGLILCQSTDRVVAEYSLRGMAKPIGASEYQLTRALRESLRSSPPTAEEIEERLEEKD